MRKIRQLVVHTAAADIANVDVSEIDDWHRKRGWKGIGYHYVIIDDRHGSLPDGALQEGRPEEEVGAHVAGLNRFSIGVCCVGHGDRRDFTVKQKDTLTDLLAQLAQRYDVPVENIIGQREVNRLIDRGEVEEEFRTSKTCPGTLLDMGKIRRLVASKLGASQPAAMAPPKDLIDAMDVIAANERLLGNALGEWRCFFFSGEMRGLSRPKSFRNRGSRAE
ncbi:hypothetical protein ABID21_004422 [Pseudorhizobium tarimense]|uniref:N-acetylmuramoyl-L-alanine amidase domain-containing protein n=1 Tax=Pseudorhizobium tarimense TaxID=1079109 RepID=A0ABV2HD22_9HYPH|nr:N-acetylmuramoyl-L-alanine amidase [Pseudorhizobium tarimense]MCJ8521304.1 N-acetylmuramoyl-L-alanine amidase [Pseudorhizobium tarimense]